VVLDAPIAAIAHAWLIENARVQPGSGVGPYRIESLLGVGGMGEVYRARDTKLNRDVAIKILPAAFATDPERLARFKREAQLLASLNHPNIAAIHGLEDSGGVHALVLELVEGPTLADRIATGPLPLDEALPIARQMAEALECAHEAGVVHRDLKPANIKVREDGTVKVLDFGLAKLAEPVGAASAAPTTQSPTITTPAMTAAGMILGTAAYMSPEQAKGKPADKRADIWAFGCVLYEMLTGTRAFDGNDVADTLAAILRSEPNWDLPQAPRALVRLIQRCLVKDSRRRWQSIGDVRLDLDEIVARGQYDDADASAHRPIRTIVWTSIVALAAITAAAIGWMSHTTTTADQRVYRTTILTPGVFTNVQAGRIALSPDGEQIAFAALDPTGHPFIWVRRLDEAAPHTIPGTEGGNGPFWSPDSRYLAFAVGGKLKKVAVAGGAPLVLADAVPGIPGAWNQDDTLLFSPSANAPLFKVSAAGGVATPVTRLDEHTGEIGHRYPVFLPDGRRFLYVATGIGRTNAVFLGSLDDSTQTHIADLNSNVAYGSNALLYLRGETLVAQPFDADRVSLKGTPTILADQIQVNSGARVGAFTISRNGQLAYMAGSSANRRVILVDSSGREERVLAGRGGVGDVQVSPNGAFAAIPMIADPASSQGRDIWLLGLRGDDNRRLTDNINATAPVWSPDGTRLLFSANRQGHIDLYVKNTSGPSAEQLILADAADKLGLDWSKSGDILYARLPPERSVTEVWSRPADAGGEPTKLFEIPAAVVTAKFSPDGRSILYSSGGGSSNSGVYVLSLQTKDRRQISVNGGTAPRWSRDGKQIFFVSQQQLFAVSFDARDFGATAPRPLFKVRVAGGVRDPYDVMPDGRHFVIQDAADQDEPITLLVNWPQLLQHQRQ
jgi:serine/threonine protein kinase